MKTLNSKSLNTKGFTIIELIIYVAIFASMIGAVVALAGLASAQKANSQITADLNYQGEAVIALINQTVHQASSITNPTAGNTGNTLTLAMAASSVNPTVFKATNDGTTSRFQVSEGSPAVTNNLTNARVTVSNLNFTNMSLASTKGSVLIRFTLTYRTTSARQELKVSKTFYGAATIP